MIPASSMPLKSEVSRLPSTISAIFSSGGSSRHVSRGGASLFQLIRSMFGSSEDFAHFLNSGEDYYLDTDLLPYIEQKYLSVNPAYVSTLLETSTPEIAMIKPLLGGTYDLMALWFNLLIFPNNDGDNVEVNSANLAKVFKFYMGTYRIQEEIIKRDLDPGDYPWSIKHSSLKDYISACEELMVKIFGVEPYDIYRLYSSGIMDPNTLLGQIFPYDRWRGFRNIPTMDPEHTFPGSGTSESYQMSNSYYYLLESIPEEQYEIFSPERHYDPEEHMDISNNFWAPRKLFLMYRDSEGRFFTEMIPTDEPHILDFSKYRKLAAGAEYADLYINIGQTPLQVEKIS